MAVLSLERPEEILSIIKLSKAGYRKMPQNLFWAVGYKVVAISRADKVLAPTGILLSPMVGAVLMSFSMIAVALNAQFLRRLGLRPVSS